jgi:peptidoglycan/xylan/chitin deacetylase (PgdA/CDA1 family)
MSPLTVAKAKMAAKRAMSRLYKTFQAGGGKHALRCLMYHSIVAEPLNDPDQMTTPLGLFRDQMAHLASQGYRVADAADVVGRLRRGEPIQSKTVVLTFDDGYADNLHLALPVLQEHGFSATVFFVTSALDGRIEHAYTGWKGRYLGWDEARELLATGVMKAGCHSRTHRRLRGLPPDELREETLGAKRRMEDRLGCAVDLFAYPFGAYNACDGTVRVAVEQAGFAGAFTTIFGANEAEADCFWLRRSRISWCEDIPEFDLLLGGGYDWYALVQWCQARRSRASRPYGSSSPVVSA